MISYPAFAWALCLTRPAILTTDSRGTEDNRSISSGAIFFFGAVIWMMPYLSLRMRNEIPPRFLTSWTHPSTTTSFSWSSLEMFFEFFMGIIGSIARTQLRNMAGQYLNFVRIALFRKDYLAWKITCAR